MPDFIVRMGRIFSVGALLVLPAHAFVPPAWYLVRTWTQQHVGAPLAAQFRIQSLRDGEVVRTLRQKIVYSIPDGLRSELTLVEGDSARLVHRHQRSLLRPDAKESVAFAWDGIWFAGSDGPVIQLLKGAGLSIDREGEAHEKAATTRLARWEQTPVWRVESSADATLDWEHDGRVPLRLQLETPTDGSVELRAEGTISAKTWNLPRKTQVWVKGVLAFAIDTEKFDVGTSASIAGANGWNDSDSVDDVTRTVVEQYLRIGW